MIRAMIFDLDGTLLNTLEDIADSVNASLRHFGLPAVAIEKVRRSVGNGAGRLIEGVLPEGAGNPEYRQILDYYVPYYEAHCNIKTKPYGGILQLLQDLKNNNIPAAIVSNKGDGAVKELASLYFSGMVHTAVGEREGIRRKPEPDSVLEAIRLLQALKAEVLYIGDSEVDLATARNAGLRSALVTWGFRTREELAGCKPDYWIDQPVQLLELIGRAV